MRSFGKLLRRALVQLAMALHLPADLLCVPLGNPPDVHACQASEERVLAAWQALR